MTTTHQLRVTFDDYGPYPYKKVVVVDIDSDDYDPENYTMGSLVWDAWTMTAWPQVKAILESTDLHEDQRVDVAFDGIYIADEFSFHVTEDQFPASWVAQNDEPLGVPA
jgi:hypothetical protein